MLRHALRRLLWIVPILIGVTLTSFALLSFVPDPADDPAVIATLSPDQATELRRSRFLDLPRFFNERPVDVVARVDEALTHLAVDDEHAEEGRASIVRLGGAALPHLLPRLDALEPTARARVAIALAPVAQRMGIASPEVVDPRQAVAFWNLSGPTAASIFVPPTLAVPRGACRCTPPPRERPMSCNSTLTRSSRSWPRSTSRRLARKIRVPMRTRG